VKTGNTGKSVSSDTVGEDKQQFVVTATYRYPWPYEKKHHKI